MTQSPFQTNQKPFQSQASPTSSKGGSRACGCIALGCGGMLMMMVLLCGGGYYAMMHTSLPLTIFEKTLEKSGNVEVEGVTGSMTTGVEVESVKFRGDAKDKNWSELKRLKIKYNGVVNMSRTNQVVIDEISVGEGTVYTSLGDGEFDLMPLDIGFGLGQEMESEFRDLQLKSNFETMKINRFEISHLTWIDQDAGLEYSIDEVVYTGLEIRNGRIVNAGDLTVKTDGLDMQSHPSEAFPDEGNARILKGEVKPAMNARILKPIEFKYDFSLDINRRPRFQSEWFDGQVLLEHLDLEKNGSIEFRDFSPDDFMLPLSPTVNPRMLSMKLEVEPENPLRPVAIDSNASFQLGETQFADVDLESLVSDQQSIVGKATVNGRQVNAIVELLHAFPLVHVNLMDAAATDPKELWAEVVFAKTWKELDESQQMAIQGSLIAVTKPTNQAEETPIDTDVPEGDSSDDASTPSDDKPGSVPEEQPTANSGG